MKYRKDIDGLRAIAVISIILYHAQLNIFQGGYLGVDIFFVISGYLITSIIQREIAENNDINLIRFYERRIRRILPLLLFVMLSSFPFACVYLLPLNYVDYSKSIISSLFFFSNYYFLSTDHIYGNVTGLFKPFLHTWSLSIEEQFYLVFPIFFLLIAKFFKKHVIKILILLVMIGLIYSDYLSKHNQLINFYGFFSRSWEFLIGSIIFILENKKTIIPTIRNQIIALIGFFLIIFSITTFSSNNPHPSKYTLIPLFGTFLVIHFSNRELLVYKILSSPILRYFGLISYSLYLWHYPVFSFALIADFTHGNILRKVMLGLLIILLSTITYWLVEKPFRSKSLMPFKLVSKILIAEFITLLLLNAAVLVNRGFEDRLPKILGKEITHQPAWNYLLNSSGDICFEKLNDYCYFEGGNNKVVFLGDSQLAILAYAFKQKYLSSYSLEYIPNFTKSWPKLHNSTIVIGGRLQIYIDEGKSNANEIALKNYLEMLLVDNKVILVYPIPEAGFPVGQKLLQEIPRNKNMMREHLEKNTLSINYAEYELQFSRLYSLYNSINSSNLYRVYPEILFCNSKVKGKCLLHDQDDIFFTDNVHPSVRGCEMINELVLKELRRIQFPISN